MCRFCGSRLICAEYFYFLFEEEKEKRNRMANNMDTFKSRVGKKSKAAWNKSVGFIQKSAQKSVSAVQKSAQKSATIVGKSATVATTRLNMFSVGRTRLKRYDTVAEAESVEFSCRRESLVRSYSEGSTMNLKLAGAPPPSIREMPKLENGESSEQEEESENNTEYFSSNLAAPSQSFEPAGGGLQFDPTEFGAPFSPQIERSMSDGVQLTFG